MTHPDTQEPRAERRRTKKVLASLAAVTMVGIVGVAGTTAALSATTDNTDNRFNAAYISLTDNDGGPGAGSFLYQVDNARAVDAPVVKCIRITYGGAAPAPLKLYLDSPLQAGAANVELKVETGSGAAGSFPDCTGFVPTAGGPAYTGDLADFRAQHNSYANGLTYGPVTNGDVVGYRVTVHLKSGVTPNATNYQSGAHTYTWAVDQNL